MTTLAMKRHRAWIEPEPDTDTREHMCGRDIQGSPILMNSCKTREKNIVLYHSTLDKALVVNGDYLCVGSG